MSVYVDNLVEGEPPWSGRASCHMMADADWELEAMARKLGIPKHWRHKDHYDLSWRLRELAIGLGAIEVTSAFLVGLRRRRRGEK